MLEGRLPLCGEGQYQVGLAYLRGGYGICGWIECFHDRPVLLESLIHCIAFRRMCLLFLVSWKRDSAYVTVRHTRDEKLFRNTNFLPKCGEERYQMRSDPRGRCPARDALNGSTIRRCCSGKHLAGYGMHTYRCLFPVGWKHSGRCVSMSYRPGSEVLKYKYQCSGKR